MIDKKFINKWGPRYVERSTGDNYIGYENLLKKVSKDISRGIISKPTFIQILVWKTPRLKGIIRLNHFEYYNKGLKQVLKSPESEKLQILDDLYGIGVPFASTILHFIYPDKFPIMDVRVTEVLCDFGYLEVKSRSPKNYIKFRDVILAIVQEFGCSIRELDCALFAYHKLKLSPQNKKEKKECGKVNRSKKE
jgi:hypothetical protein